MYSLCRRALGGAKRGIGRGQEGHWVGHWAGPRTLRHALRQYTLWVKVDFNLTALTLTAKLISPSNFLAIRYATYVCRTHQALNTRSSDHLHVT